MEQGNDQSRPPVSHIPSRSFQQDHARVQVHSHQNNLIAALPRADRTRLLAHSQLVNLELAQVLCEPGQPMRKVYFPVDAFISLIAQVDGVRGLEVGMAGREGMLGVHLALGIAKAPLQALVQGAGSAWCVAAVPFRAELARIAALRGWLDKYLYVLMAQSAAAAACLRFHEICPRLARWILMSQDRAHAGSFPLTQEFGATMLGVRRVGVTAAAGASGHQLVVTHGNGPQVGLLALQGAAYKPDEAYPLDVLGAETEGMIGYLIEQELENALDHEHVVATLLTQVVVDHGDPAFAKPTKFVGPVYDKAEAESRAAAAGWQIAEDGDFWRRVVPSPAPLEIPDFRVLKLLLDQQIIVICAGGGGIPVVRREDGSLTGVEAVIDKDAASALLARQLGADALLLLTDVARSTATMELMQPRPSIK